MTGKAGPGWRAHLIWIFAFGYFACYAPYSAITKALTKGLFPSMERPLSGFELLPATVIVSTAGILAYQFLESALLLSARVGRPQIRLHHGLHLVRMVLEKLPLRHQHIHDVALQL